MIPTLDVAYVLLATYTVDLLVLIVAFAIGYIIGVRRAEKRHQRLGGAGKSKFFASLLALCFCVACNQEDWCAAELKAHGIAAQVLPALATLAPDKAGPLQLALETAHAGVTAIGCDGDKATLGDRVAAVAQVATQVLALYGQIRGRDLHPPITEADRLKALEDLEDLQASIARGK